MASKKGKKSPKVLAGTVQTAFQTHRFRVTIKGHLMEANPATAKTALFDRAAEAAANIPGAETFVVWAGRVK